MWTVGTCFVVIVGLVFSYLATCLAAHRMCAPLQANHLVGLKRTYLKLLFLSLNDLMKARRELLPAVRKNQERQSTSFTRVLGSVLLMFTWHGTNTVLHKTKWDLPVLSHGIKCVGKHSVRMPSIVTFLMVKEAGFIAIWIWKGEQFWFFFAHLWLGY